MKRKPGVNYGISAERECANHVRFGRPAYPTSPVRSCALRLDAEDRICHWIFGYAIHQTDLQGFSSVQLLGGNKHPQRLCFLNQPWKSLRPTPSRDQTKRGAAMAKNRVGSRNSSMTSQCQI